MNQRKIGRFLFYADRGYCKGFGVFLRLGDRFLTWKAVFTVEVWFWDLMAGVVVLRRGGMDGGYG